MALSDYSGLKATIANWLDRDDADLIADYITLAESDMNARIRSRQNTVLATVTFGADGLAPLPNGYRQVKAMRLFSAPGNPLDSVSLERMSQLLASNAEAGSPREFSVEGVDFRVHPTPSADVNALCHYYRTIPPLSDADTSNWVLQHFPNAYLYGALSHGFAWADDERNETRYAARFASAIETINAEGRDLYGDSASMVVEATP